MQETELLRGDFSKKVCVQCINFIEENKNVSCDYGYFENIQRSKSMLFTPIDFECMEYEEI